MARAYWQKPCAMRGLQSFRYRGPFGYVMIGARDELDAMQEARRSTCNPERDKLERWNGAAYVAAFP